MGPLLCSLLLGWNGNWPFWCAIALALAGGLATPRGGAAAPRVAADAPGAGFIDTLSRLRQDRVLVLFTLSCALANLVYARFSNYLPLYLMQTLPEVEVLRWMSALISCNAVCVVLLQYPLGRGLRPGRLMPAIGAGFILLGLGTLGFGWMPGGLWGMCAAMLVFSLGEIVLVPAEYLYIDAIAPEDCKGIYYGAQNLASLGARWDRCWLAGCWPARPPGCCSPEWRRSARWPGCWPCAARPCGGPGTAVAGRLRP